MEGALFGGCIVGAMIIARRSLSGNGEQPALAQKATDGR
jgi:hypothetical protein